MLANKYIPIDEAAETAYVYINTLKKAADRGLLTLYRIGGKRFFDAKEIEEFRKEYTGNIMEMRDKGRKEKVITGYLTPPQLARKIGYKSNVSIYARINTGEIPAERIGGRWFIKTKESKNV